MKLGRQMHCTKISAEFEFGGHRPPGCTTPKCGIGLRHWGNQHRLSSVLCIHHYSTFEILTPIWWGRSPYVHCAMYMHSSDSFHFIWFEMQKLSLDLQTPISYKTGIFQTLKDIFSHFIGNICNIYISSLFDPIVTFEVNMTIHYTVMMFSLLAGYVALWLWPSDLKHLPPIMCHVINPGTNCELSKAIHSRGVMAHTYCSWQYE